MSKYRLEITTNKGEILAKFETTSKIIFDSVYKVLRDENLIEDQSIGESQT